MALYDTMRSQFVIQSEGCLVSSYIANQTTHMSLVDSITLDYGILLHHTVLCEQGRGIQGFSKGKISVSEGRSRGLSMRSLTLEGFGFRPAEG